MLASLVLLQVSLVARPMYVSDARPELRSARHILLMHVGAKDARADVARTREETLALAADLVARLRAGAGFETLAAEYSQDPDAQRGAVLGSFPPGMLAPELDKFLFSAAEGDISDPIANATGVHVLQRLETCAAVLHILVRGTGDESRARCSELVARLREGADFATLARERSEDEESARRGGQFAIYERGPRDTLLKAAAFHMGEGEILGPLESPLGWHVLKRVGVGDVDPALRERSFVRVRAILVQFDVAKGADPLRAPPQVQARATAQALWKRIHGGEDMRTVAREFNDDPGGRERAGDLGWIYRSQPGLPHVLQNACRMRVGELSEPTVSSVGYLILRREE